MKHARAFDPKHYKYRMEITLLSGKPQKPIYKNNYFLLIDEGVKLREVGCKVEVCDNRTGTLLWPVEEK